jgi:hypothetical protein
MTFLQTLQEKLMELYKDFPNEIQNTTIQLDPTECTITTLNQTIQVPVTNIKRTNFTPFLTDIIEADLDFDFGLYAENNLNNLLHYVGNLQHSNGKRILAYSLLETKMNHQLQQSSKRELLKFLRENSSQNERRLRLIARRANQLLNVIDEFPIKLLEKITPKWLYRLTEREFNEFISKCQRLNSLNQHFAGAQS